MADPMPIDTAKIARYAVTAISWPPSVCFTNVGISDRATAPISQNHDTIQLACIIGLFSHNSPKRRRVERMIFRSMVKSGSAAPVLGMYRLNIQQIIAKPIIIGPKIQMPASPLNVIPATIVPDKIARNVPASTHALAFGKSGPSI